MNARAGSWITGLRFWQVTLALGVAAAALLLLVPKAEAVVSLVLTPTIVDAETGTATDYTFVFTTANALDHTTDNEEIRIVLPAGTTIAGGLVAGDVTINAPGGAATNPDSIAVNGQEIQLGVPDASNIDAAEVVTVIFTNTRLTNPPAAAGLTYTVETLDVTNGSDNQPAVTSATYEIFALSIDDVSVTPSSILPGAAATYTITLQVASNFVAGDNLVIVFPGNTTLQTSDNVADVTANLNGGGATNMQGAAEAVAGAQTLTIDLNDVLLGGQALAETGDTIVLVISTIVTANTTTTGTTTLTVAKSGGTAETSAAFAIVTPALPAPPPAPTPEPEPEPAADTSPFDTATGTTTLTTEGTANVDLAAETTTDSEGREVARVSSAAGDLSADVPVSGLPAGTTSVDLTLQTVDAGRADVAVAIDAAGIAPADAVVVEFLVSDQNGNAITDFGGQTLFISIKLSPADAADKAVFKLVGSTLTQIPEAQLSRGADGTITVSLTDDIVLVVGPPPAEVAPVEEEPAVPGVIPLAFRGAPARGDFRVWTGDDTTVAAALSGFGERILIVWWWDGSAWIPYAPSAPQRFQTDFALTFGSLLFVVGQ